MEPKETRTFASLFSSSPSNASPGFPPSIFSNGRIAIKTSQAMINNSTSSFAHVAMGRFFSGKRPLNGLSSQWSILGDYLLCLVSLTSKGFFFFQFGCPEDQDKILSSSKTTIGKKRLHLVSWVPGQEEFPSYNSPNLDLLGNIPFHCWSRP